MTFPPGVVGTGSSPAQGGVGRRTDLEGGREGGGLRRKYIIMLVFLSAYGLFVCHYALVGSIKTLNGSESLESLRVLRM